MTKQEETPVSLTDEDSSNDSSMPSSSTGDNRKVASQKPRWIDRIDFFVPSENPLLWVCINVIVTVYSLMLLQIDYFASESAGTQFEELAQANYIIYDFSTTMLWLVQVSLIILYDGWESSNLEMKIMAGVAGIFLLDSTFDLYMWQIREVDIRGDAFWTVLNMIFYVYEAFELSMLFKSRIEFKEKHHEELEADERLKVRSHRYTRTVEAVRRIEVKDDWVGRGTHFVSSTIPRKASFTNVSRNRASPKERKAVKWIKRASRSFRKQSKSRGNKQQDVKPTTSLTADEEEATEESSLIMWA